MSRLATRHQGGLKAIAEEANVSVSLVSRVLNDRLGNCRVAPKTADAVRTAARRLGYRKNHAAAALVAGRQNVIGGYIHTLGNRSSGLIDALVHGMAEGANRRGRRLMLRFFQHTDEFLACLPEISSSLLDGLIVAGVRHHDLGQQLQEIHRSGVPVITVHEEHQEPEFTNVFVDQPTICRLATEHLLAQGCRRIAHIMMKPLRYRGYQQALAAAGIAEQKELVFTARGFRYQAGQDAVRHFAAQGVEFDGLVAQSDEQAIGALNTLLAMGRRVPEDVKVIGVDDSPACELAPVPLSSVSSEFQEQGRRAVDLLIDHVEGRPSQSVGVTPVLRPRASSMASAHVTRG